MRARHLSTGRTRRLTLLIALLIVSAGIRLPGLFSRAIWEDESITLLETTGHAVPAWPAEPAPASVAKSQFEGTSSLKQILDDLITYDAHPPLYYWSVFVWQHCWGPSLNATRALSLVYSVLTLWVLYEFVCVAKFVSPLIPTSIYAFSSGSVHFGQEARSYALVALLTTLAALCAYLATESTGRDRWRFGAYGMGAGFFCGAAFATHYFALFPACVILAWFLASARPGFRLIAAILTLACSIGFLGLLTLLNQSVGDGRLFSGYYGLLKEVVAVGRMNVNLLWASSVSLFTGTLAGLARGLI